MTYIFDLQLQKVQISTGMPEWEAMFSFEGEGNEKWLVDSEGRKAVEIIDAWKNGSRRTQADEMPKRLVAERVRKKWPDAFKARNGLVVVSAAAKKVLEQLDPSVHQFFPLTFTTKGGKEIDGPWFAMNVTAKQDSVLVKRSRVFVNSDYPDTLCSFYSDSKPEDIVVDVAGQSSLNLWREARFVGSLLGSDTLIQEMNAQGLRFFPSFKATNFNV